MSQTDRLLACLLVLNWLRNRWSGSLPNITHLHAPRKLARHDAAITAEIALGCRSNGGCFSDVDRPAGRNLFAAKLESRCQQNHTVLELNHFKSTQTIVAVSCRNTLAAARQGRHDLPALLVHRLARSCC